MHHQREVGVFPGAFSQQLDLAAAVFFGGSAEQLDAQPRVRGQWRQSQCRPQACCRDHIVAAAVTDARQRVVLAADHHGEIAVAVQRLDGGWHAIGADLDLETGVVEDECDAFGCPELLPGQLRVRVNRVIQGEQIVGAALQFRLDTLLRYCEIQPGHPGSLQR
ncbi:hypothetical protein SDC9_152636 [bioreactor metagenome]|uniref:Uncharacterized protein n=1 Tax=bioreactor metagenome TaxID=1076179 RepID=A0A645EVD0_9ZZZZ